MDRPNNYIMSSWVRFFMALLTADVYVMNNDMRGEPCFTSQGPTEDF